MAGPVVLCQVPLWVLLFQGLVGGGELGLPHGEKHDHHRHRHDEGDHQEQGLVVDVVQPSHLAGGVHHRGDGQVQDAAHRAHEVDDGVGLRAQGFGGDVRHEGHRRGAVHPHGHQQQGQHDDEGHQLEGGGLGGVAVVQHGQQVHEDDREGSAREDIGGALAQLCIRPVGQAAEQGQQE